MKDECQTSGMTRRNLLLQLAAGVGWTLVGSRAGLAEPPDDPIPAELQARWQQLSESEREQFRQRYQAFLKQDPQERRELLERWQRFRQMTDAQREQVRRNYQRFSRLRPEERRDLRQAFLRFRGMPAGEKQRIRKAFATILRLPQSERAKVLQKLQRWRELSPERRLDILRQWRKRHL